MGKRIKDATKLKCSLFSNLHSASRNDVVSHLLPELDPHITKEVSEKEETGKLCAVAMLAFSCLDEEQRRRPCTEDIHMFFHNL